MERNNTRATTPLRQNGKSTPQLIKDVLLLCLQNWYWFVLSLLVALGIGFYLTVQKQPVYLRTASIMVKDSKSADATEAMLKDMGIVQTSTNLTNELLLLKSSVVADEVVKRLRLDVDYSRKGKFYDPVMYGINRPLEVRFLDLNDQENAALTVALQADSTVRVSGLRRRGVEYTDNYEARLGDTLETVIGRLAVVGSPYYVDGAKCQLDVRRTGLDAATSRVRSKLTAQLRDNNSSIIDIRYRDVSPGRADDVLNTLMAVYNEKWMQDRNKQIVSTNEFIRERLAVIESELGNVEQNISSYKSEHLITDVGQAGAMAAAQVSEVESQSTELQNKISQLHTVYDYLISTQDDTQQIPFNLGIDNAAIVQKISEYNTLLLQRNNHLAYSSSQNPLVLDLNKQLASIRRSIVEALGNELSLLRTQQRNLQAVRSRAVSRVATNPQQAKYLLSVERQQKVKEELYLFLLQKREENELSQAFTAYNSQIIEPAHGSWKPVEPVPKTIYLFAILLGLGIPAAFLFLKEVLTTTIQSREDLKQMSVPFAGEIPLATANQGFFGRLFLKAKPHGKAEVLVVEKNRNMINEAFSRGALEPRILAGLRCRAQGGNAYLHGAGQRQDFHLRQPIGGCGSQRQTRAGRRPRPAQGFALEICEPPVARRGRLPERPQRRLALAARAAGQGRPAALRQLAAQPLGTALLAALHAADGRGPRRVRLRVPRLPAGGNGGRRRHHQPLCRPHALRGPRPYARPLAAS